MHLTNTTKERGFTLIELLVVIAIIGLLSSVVLASLNSARVKARNTRRLSTIEQYSIALELLFDDNGQYPDDDPAKTWTCLGEGYSDGNCWWGSWNEYGPLNISLLKYLPVLTAGDFVGGIEGYIYSCSPTDCSGYDIRWMMEDTDQSCGAGTVRDPDSSGATYCELVR